MSVLFLQGDGYTYDGIDLTGESSLTISLEDNGTAGLTLDYLVLSGTTSVTIRSGGDPGGYNALHQLADISNVLTTVTLKGSEPFTLGSPAGASNAGDGVVTFGRYTFDEDCVFADAHRCVGDDRRGENLCRCHKYEQRGCLRR